MIYVRSLRSCRSTAVHDLLPGPGVPLGTRTAPTGCFAGLFSDKRDARGYSWSSTIPSGNTNAHLLVFYYFLARMASKTPRGRGFPLRCLQEHPEGVLLACRVSKASAANRLCKENPSKTPCEPGPGQSQRRRRSVDSRWPHRVQLGIVHCRWQCSPLGLPPRLDQFTGWQRLPCVRLSVALPPGRGRGRWAPGRSLPVPRRGPTLSGRINLFPLPRSSRGGSYFL